MFSRSFSGAARLVAQLAVLSLLSLVCDPAAGSQRQLLSRERIETVLRGHVIETGPWQAHDIDLRVVSFQPIPLPNGPLTFRVLRPSQGVTPGTIHFLLAADVAGEEAAKVAVRAELKVYAEVVVTAAPLAHRETLSAKDVRLERRDISSLRGRPFSRIADVAGQQAARAIEANEILTQKSVDLPLLLRRGSAVTLIYETGSLRVETAGVAEENGKAGDLIQVKNPTSGKMLRGLVVNGRTVRVD